MLGIEDYVVPIDKVTCDVLEEKSYQILNSEGVGFLSLLNEEKRAAI